MIRGFIDFSCQKGDLEQVANLISVHLTGKENSFKGRENYVRDEIPTVYTEIFLGIRIYLMQNPEEANEFQIDMTDKIHWLTDQYDAASENIDFSERIYLLLKSCDGLIFPEEYSIQWPNKAT